MGLSEATDARRERGRERLREEVRELHEANDRLKERWDEALADGERYRQEAKAARDLVRTLRAERDAARVDAQSARDRVGTLREEYGELWRQAHDDRARYGAEIAHLRRDRDEARAYAADLVVPDTGSREEVRKLRAESNGGSDSGES